MDVDFDGDNAPLRVDAAVAASSRSVSTTTLRVRAAVTLLSDAAATPLAAASRTRADSVLCLSVPLPLISQRNEEKKERGESGFNQ
jgi:hypothetical protein